MRVLRHEESIKIRKKEKTYTKHMRIWYRETLSSISFQKEDMLQKISDLDNLEARNLLPVEDRIRRETFKNGAARCGISRRNLLEAQVEG